MICVNGWYTEEIGAWACLDSFASAGKTVIGVVESDGEFAALYLDDDAYWSVRDWWVKGGGLPHDMKLQLDLDPRRPISST